MTEAARIPTTTGGGRGKAPMFAARDQANRQRVKIFDGRPTVREDFYKRGLLAIMQAKQDKDTDPAYLIAEAVLDAAGLSVIDPEEAERRFRLITASTLKERHDNKPVVEEVIEDEEEPEDRNDDGDLALA